MKRGTLGVDGRAGEPWGIHGLLHPLHPLQCFRERESPGAGEKYFFLVVSEIKKYFLLEAPGLSGAQICADPARPARPAPPAPVPPLVGQVAPAGNRAALLGPLLLRLEYS